MKVLVTGGAGYIGSHTVSTLLRRGYEIVVLDNLSTGFREAIPAKVEFVLGDVKDEPAVAEILRKKNIQAVVHFAAKLNVRESMTHPLDYYENNTLGTLSLLKAMVKEKVRPIVFSSTGSVYGNSIQGRAILETDPKAPLNPYAQSKLMCEKMMSHLSDTGEIRFSALRYFNAAGAASDGSNGQRTAQPYHLVHMGVQAALGKKNGVQIFGTDYPTPDGSCIRDFIHVEDLAEIHALALQDLLSGAPSEIYNCGYGIGYSVREVVATVRTVSGVDFTVTEAERRPGDAVSLIADSTKLKTRLGWIPKKNDLQQICRDAFRWEKSVLEFGVKLEQFV